MKKSYRKVLRGKIHRATVTHADLNYEGSVTIPPELLAATGIVEYEAVNIWNVTRGTRLETYAITGQPQSTDICVNGAAAHLVKPGDIVIIACFFDLHEKYVKDYKPSLVFVDSNNRIDQIRSEIPGPGLMA
ncbi:MAG: aspartate 1-decarboxylase [bacterium]|nr:aspartate 1-decarboxylase [bacterium]